MDEHLHYSGFPSDHTAAGDNVPSGSDPFASETTLDQQPLGDFSSRSAEGLPSTGGSNYGRTAAQSHSNQYPYPRRVSPYIRKAAAPPQNPTTYKTSALQVPAQSQHPNFLSPSDLAFQQSYPSQFQDLGYLPLDDVHGQYGALSGHQSQFPAGSIPEQGNLTLGQKGNSLTDLNAFADTFQTMPEKRGPYQYRQSSRHTPTEPLPKRRKVSASGVGTRATYAPNIQQPPSITAPPQIPAPKVHTLLACCLLAWCHPKGKPTVELKEDLSNLCEEDSSVVDCIFEARENIGNDAEIPNVLMEAAGELWKVIHPDATPLPWQVTMLERIIGASPKSMSHWFVRNQKDLTKPDDSAYGTLTETVTNMDREIASRRLNRKRCKPNPEVKSPLPKKSEGKYMCTSLCGKSFDSADNWKKHEMNNRLQKAWLCDFPSCRRNAEDFVWPRKESLLKHVEKHHPDSKDKYQARCIEIKGNVRGNCLWRTCCETFTCFQDFMRHTKKHCNEDWKAADLRDPEDETDAFESLLSADSGNFELDLQNDDNDDEDPPSPNAGAGPSSGHQPSHSYGSGSGNPGSGSGSSAPDKSGTGRSGALGNRFQTCSNDGMQLKNLGPLKTLEHSASADLGMSHSLSAKQIWQQMASWSPRLDFLGRLGSGATAVVDKVSIAGVSGTLACKTFPARWRFELFQELQTMSRLRHPHIVALFHAYFRAGSTSILMQPVADYNLSQYLAKNAFTPTEQSNMWLWFSCLTSGLHHMHKHGVLHHDIKPSNILVMDQTVFYSDFGSSASMADEQAHNFRRWGFTRVYAAPEVFQGDRRSASDIFSLGCVFLEMITVLYSQNLRQQLHGLQSEAYQKNHTSLHWASTWNNRLWDLSKHQMTGSKVRELLQICQKMTDPQADQRPTAAEVDKRLNPRLCRSCSHSTKWPGKKALTWPLDQSSLKSLRGLESTEQDLAKAKESVLSRIRKPSWVSRKRDQLSWVSRKLGQLSLEDASESESENLLSETGENKTIKEVRVNHEFEVFRSMMACYLMDQDPRERFRASGESVMPKLFNAVGLPSQYPTDISM